MLPEGRLVRRSEMPTFFMMKCSEEERKRTRAADVCCTLPPLHPHKPRRRTGTPSHTRRGTHHKTPWKHVEENR